jgi:hypothetical protein
VWLQEHIPTGHVIKIAWITCSKYDGHYIGPYLGGPRSPFNEHKNIHFDNG